MREDMSKVIVERPRSGSGWTTKRLRKRWQHYPMDEWPTKESHMQELRGFSKKCLNENLAPLRRFLRSHIGMPWNDVNSEIRERINLNSAVQLHIWQHVQDYVCMDPIERDGKLFNKGGYELRHFYVDPATGILNEVPNVSLRRKTLDPTPYVRINDWTHCRKLNGIWFVITLKPIPADVQMEWDVVFKKLCKQITAAALRNFYGHDAYAVSKRQLSKKEIALLKANKFPAK